MRLTGFDKTATSGESSLSHVVPFFPKEIAFFKTGLTFYVKPRDVFLLASS